jgi:hypothetical protein
MSSAAVISFTLNTTSPESKLGFEAWIDDRKFVDLEHVQEAQVISMEITEDDAEHELRFILKNKTNQHTRVDENNNIVSDATLSITDLTFDEIQLGHTVTELAEYKHNFNNNGDTVEDKFYGSLGCNGTVSLKFATPMYLWLLEHM